MISLFANFFNIFILLDKRKTKITKNQCIIEYLFSFPYSARFIVQQSTCTLPINVQTDAHIYSTVVT